MTQEDKRLVCRAAMHLETGRHLLERMPDDEVAMIRELCETLATNEKDRTERQKEIYEEYLLDTDFDYWTMKKRQTSAS